MSQSVIFLPGWGLGHSPWQATADACGGSILDLPGYGNVPLVPTFDAAVDILASRLPPATLLCGWSLGAMLALAIAARHPEKVGKLVLVAGTLSFIQRDNWPHAMAPATLADFTVSVAADAATALPRFVGGFNRGDSRAKAVTRELLGCLAALPQPEVLTTGLNWLRDADLRSLAPQVAVPTLALHGAADPLMPLAAAEAMAAAIPGARLESFAECAHAPFISAPAPFCARLTEFRHDPSC